MTPYSENGHGSLALADDKTLRMRAATRTFPADAPDLDLPDGGALVKMEIDGRPILDLLSFAHSLLTSMDENAYFPDPMPAQDVFSQTVEEAKASTMRVMALRSELAAAVSTRDMVIDRLTQQIRQRGNYVQMRSCGIAHRIFSAGMDVRRDRRPVPDLAAPEGLRADLGETVGLMCLTWYKVKNAKAYLMEYGPVNGPMIQRPVTGLRKLVLDDLELGVPYQFRICAIGGPRGHGDWSPWVVRAAA